MFSYLKTTKAVQAVKVDHVIPIDGLQCQQLEINHNMSSDAIVSSNNSSQNHTYDLTVCQQSDTSMHQLFV